MKRKVRPNVVSGGTAINLGNNLYYMRGKTHKQGGIDIGSNPKTGIEVENGEVVQTSPTGLRVFSAQPILNGISPANALLMGGSPNNIFNAQEAWKQVNHYNDDGTKFEGGGYTPSQEIIDYIKKTEGFRDKWYKDGNGIDTIGYGFTGSRIKKLYPNGITREQADKEFADSLVKRALILAKDTPNWNKLSQSQRDALLSYHYNVGEGSYRNKHKKLQQALADSDWENVILNMDAGYNDKKNPGLRTRRDYERELFRSGMVASLTGDEEKAFRDWYDRYSRSQNLDPNPDAKEHYYDYRTYWKNRTPEQKNDEWKLGNHLPDTYKKPGHPTFSTESIYSTRKTPGGTWKKVGLGPVYDEQFVDSKYTKNLRKYQNVSFKYGGIHIKPSKRGTFTAAAKRHHMSVQEFARTVLNNRARYSAAMVKKANFARNASKWHKKELGGDMTKQYYITKNNVYSLGGNKIEDKYVLGFNDELGLTDSIPASTVIATRTSPIEHITNYYRLKEFLNRRRKKAPYGTQYRVDENGRLVPVKIPKLPVPIADLSGRNDTLEPITIVDTGRKLPTITGKAENPETIVGNTFPNQNIKRTIPVSIQDITTPITSPNDAQLNKPEFYSTVKSSFSNPNYSLGIQDVKNPKTSELPGGTKSSSGKTPKNPYYSKLNIGLKKIGNFLASPDGADLLGLGINLTGNLASSLINRKAIKNMKYVDAPIPISAQKLPTEVNVEPQVSSIRENIAGQERLIGDNTSDSRVALARRQKVRNQGLQQYQSLMGNKQNTELQLLSADRLNRQGVDAQNINNYNQWRRGLYDFNNRKIEMQAENSVAGINNAAEAIAGEKGYFARREARQQNLLDMALIAATSPNAQNVIGSKEFEDFLRRIGYDGRFGLLRKRINGDNV